LERLAAEQRVAVHTGGEPQAEARWYVPARRDHRRERTMPDPVIEPEVEEVPAVEEDLVEEDLVVEDVSIDGMCGVY
jgi:mycofactocin precursor